MDTAIHRLHMARLNLSGQFNPPTYEDTRIDVYAYLMIQGANVLLIDTGVGSGNDYIDRQFEPETTPIAQLLRDHGVEATDVGFIVNSHLHFDHCGNNQMFPNAKILVNEDELKVARSPLYTVREWFDYEGAELTPVSGDFEILPGIKILASPGHTPGHQSVLVETANGNTLIAAQAAFTADEFTRGGDPKEQAHEGLQQQYMDSIAQLKTLAPQRIFFSHDNQCAAQV